MNLGGGVFKCRHLKYEAAAGPCPGAGLGPQRGLGLQVRPSPILRRLLPGRGAERVVSVPRPARTWSRQGRCHPHTRVSSPLLPRVPSLAAITVGVRGSLCIQGTHFRLWLNTEREPQRRQFEKVHCLLTVLSNKRKCSPESGGTNRVSVQQERSLFRAVEQVSAVVSADRPQCPRSEP